MCFVCTNQAKKGLANGLRLGISANGSVSERFNVLVSKTGGNNDGVADIWTDEADVFASAATYLQKRGWKNNTPWRLLADGVNVNGVKLNTRGLSEPQPLSFWQSKGFKVPEGQNLNNTMAFRYYHPQADGPAYLLGPNFSVILSWNNSSYFAWSVLALADTIEAESK